MKESTNLRIIGIVILIICAAIDMIPFTFITAIGGIYILLFRPKWLLNFFDRIYEREETR
ncbi:MAG: hypothetical protein ACUVWJ_03020 [Spirochaetota bacterium]